MQKILPCHLHDYIEIACLYRFEIELELKNQQVVRGIAVTTEITPSKTELLSVQVEGQIEKIEMMDIKVMRSVTKNQHFDVVEFS